MIEEGFMRQIFKTTKGCPLVQLYLEFSQHPARFEIIKIRLLFLKTILDEDEESMISKFVRLQQEQSVKGDWISTCFKDLKSLDMSVSLSEIRNMSKNSFRKILNKRIRIIAFNYLKRKQGRKGSEILYKEYVMQEYLLPNDIGLTIEDQQYLFKIRNKMVNIPANFGGISTCLCGENEDMSHIISCPILNKCENEENLNIEKIYNGSLIEQKQILKKFQQNFQEKERLENENFTPSEPNSVPHFSV